MIAGSSGLDSQTVSEIFSQLFESLSDIDRLVMTDRVVLELIKSTLPMQLF